MSSSEFSEKLEAAKRLESIGDLQSAKKFYGEVIEALQSSSRRGKAEDLLLADAYFGQANCLRKIGRTTLVAHSNWRRAVKLCEKAFKIYEKHSQTAGMGKAEIVSGICFWKIGSRTKLEKASLWLTKGTERLRGTPHETEDWLFALGLIHLSKLSLRIPDVEKAAQMTQQALDWLKTYHEGEGEFDVLYFDVIPTKSHVNLINGQYDEILAFLEDEQTRYRDHAARFAILTLEQVHVVLKLAIGVSTRDPDAVDRYSQRLATFLKQVEDVLPLIADERMELRIRRRMETLKFGWMRLGGELDEDLLDKIMTATYPASFSEEEVSIYKGQAEKDLGWIYFAREAYDDAMDFFSEAVNHFLSVEAILTPLEKLSWAEAEVGLAKVQVVAVESSSLDQLIVNRLQMAREFCNILPEANTISQWLPSEIDAILGEL